MVDGFEKFEIRCKIEEIDGKIDELLIKLKEVVEKYKIFIVEIKEFEEKKVCIFFCCIFGYN